jgi:hypothetical protein
MDLVHPASDRCNGDPLFDDDGPLNDAGHPVTCGCPDCLPEAYDADHGSAS